MFTRPGKTLSCPKIEDVLAEIYGTDGLEDQF